MGIPEDEQIELEVAKAKCELDHLFFTRYFFKHRQAIKFLRNWHHRYIADIVDDVIAGRRQNVVINVPPGGTKTELVVINFIARGLALNPWARFLHLSGSNELASLNSSTARDLVISDEYQQFWPLKVADDAKAKKRWNVEVNGKIAGGVYATAIGGQVTGFRAGHMAPGFQGAILIDDPIKPEDAFSRSKVDSANRKILTTIKSRKANPATPIILIMQRVAPLDPTGFILAGNVEGEWDPIRIPAILDFEYLKGLPSKYLKLIGESEMVDGRFSYWPYKEPLQQLLTMERGDGRDQTGARVSRHVYASQYDQRPKQLGGNLLKGEYFRRYQVLPKLKYRKIFADTAQKTKERNDYSVFQEWGVAADGLIYLVDMIRGKWEAPELQRRAMAFWAKCKARDTEQFGSLRKMMVEDKSSGTGLVQTLKLPPYNVLIEGIERSKDKLERAKDAQPYLEAGQCAIPEDHPLIADFVSEIESFTEDDSHDFDDQVDPFIDAVIDMLQANDKLKQWEILGKKKEGQQLEPKKP